MKIQAAVLHEVHEPFRIEEVDLEMPHAGEVLVKVAAAGVCHSDWRLVTGATKHALPVVPGHEGAGVVTAIGAPAGILLQDVADVFHTEMVLPQHFEVASAIPSPISN